MRILGLPVPFARNKRAQEKALHPVGTRDSFWAVIRESFAGAWQSNVEIKLENVLTFHAAYACVTLIAGDIGKLRLKLVQRDADGIWNEIRPASPIFTKPNRFQTRAKFIEQWVVSKLLNGNAYMLKVRNERRLVQELYVLDPCRVTPLVADDGSVFYQIGRDDLSGIHESQIVVPASEIIHDTMIPLHHPLVGVSPITACGLAAVQGIEIQKNSESFFRNGSRPGGILTAPGEITNDTAARLKEHWDNNYTGVNAGKVAVLGDGLKYEAMTIPASDAQMLEQLKWTAEMVASCFHVPPYKIGSGPIPTYQNAAILNQIYYSDCLQTLIENIEALLDDGLGFGEGLGVEFDLDDLMRMDAKTQVDTYAEAVKGSVMAPNEARKKMNLRPLKGGDTVYLQQQNYSLEALDERDKTNPLAAPTNNVVDGITGDVQATALNGAQVSALLSIIEAVTNGTMPLETAIAMIGAAFPALTDDEIEAIVSPLSNFEGPPEEPANDDQEEVEQQAAFIPAFTKHFSEALNA